MADDILVERAGRIAILTLNRPEQLNALTRDMWGRLGVAIGELSAADIGCIVLRGAGEAAFAPGADIKEFPENRSTVDRAKAYGEIVHAALDALAACPHPMVAMIHGLCVGGGLEIAAQCDIRICGESSRFGIPINRLGTTLAYRELQALLAVASPALAAEILLEGRVFGAAEAREKGMVTRVVADGEVTAEAMECARRIAAGAPLVNRWHKKFLRRLRDPSPLSDAERDEGYACFATEDLEIGYRAFLDKTKPEFKGR